MRTRFTLTICALAILPFGTGHAQSVPEGQSCGGLLCDMGVFGHKTVSPPPPAPPVAAAPPPAPTPPAAAPKVVASPEPIAKKKLRVAHRKALPKVRSAAKTAAPAAPPSAPVTAAAPAAAPTTPPAPPRDSPLMFQTVDPRM